MKEKVDEGLVISGSKFSSPKIVISCKSIVLDIGCKNSHVEITTEKTNFDKGLFNLDLFDYIEINGKRFIRERDDNE